ncbi:MAG: alpha/beta fold hydrolase [Candidatus Woesearchaeota archaeon]
MKIKPEKITLTTKDGQVLQGNYFHTQNTKCALLLHQFSKDKTSWIQLIETIMTHHSILAIDLRGHGESTGNYTTYSEKEFKSMREDVECAMNFLKKEGFKEQNISLIGASIGANLAQNHSAKNKTDKTILLSPGLNYKGIELIIKDTKTLLIVSKEDTYSYKSVQEIEKKCPHAEAIYLENKGHGTNMLSNELISSIHLFLIE